MQRFAAIFVLLVSLACGGCETSRVFNRPLAEVRQVVRDMQPDMLTEISDECHQVGVTTDDTDFLFAIHVQDTLRSGPWIPSLTVEARSRGDAKTKVTVSRMAVAPETFYGVTRRRDLEKRRLDALATRLENKK